MIAKENETAAAELERHLSDATSLAHGIKVHELGLAKDMVGVELPSEVIESVDEKVIAAIALLRDAETDMTEAYNKMYGEYVDGKKTSKSDDGAILAGLGILCLIGLCSK